MDQNLIVCLGYYSELEFPLSNTECKKRSGSLKIYTEAAVSIAAWYVKPPVRIPGSHIRVFEMESTSASGPTFC